LSGVLPEIISRQLRITYSSATLDSTHNFHSVLSCCDDGFAMWLLLFLWLLSLLYHMLF